MIPRPAPLCPPSDSQDANFWEKAGGGAAAGRAGGAATPTGEEGQAATELALVLPLITLLLLAAAQVTLVLRDQILVVHAAREGARQAAVDPRGPLVRAAILRSGTLKGSRVHTDTSGVGEMSTVVVRVTYRSPTEVPVIGAVLPDFVIRAKAAMRVESGHTS